MQQACLPLDEARSIRRSSGATSNGRWNLSIRRNATLRGNDAFDNTYSFADAVTAVTVTGFSGRSNLGQR